MAGKQIQKKETGQKESRREPARPQNLSKKGEDLTEEMDGLIEEIDGILEENAEEFVKNYVQRGGE